MALKIHSPPPSQEPWSCLWKFLLLQLNIQSITKSSTFYFSYRSWFFLAFFTSTGPPSSSLSFGSLFQPPDCCLYHQLAPLQSALHKAGKQIKKKKMQIAFCPSLLKTLQYLSTHNKIKFFSKSKHDLQNPIPAGLYVPRQAFLALLIPSLFMLQTYRLYFLPLIGQDSPTKWKQTHSRIQIQIIPVIRGRWDSLD